MATGDALLALLVLGPRHGYDLKRAYDDWFSGLRPMAFGQVYSTLSRLQRDDLIQVAQTETAEGPERTVYELTSAGRTRAQEWLSEPIDPDVPGGATADELIRKTLAAYRLHADPGGLVARQRTMHLRAMRALQPASGGEAESLGRIVTGDYRRQHLDADLRWLEATGERIRRLPAPPIDALLGPVLPDSADETDGLTNDAQSGEGA